MFKDDRMISVLSGIVLMLAVGTLVQRGDVVLEFLTGAPDPIVLAPDEVTVAADTLTRIDVLGNDEGLRDGQAEKLVVLTQPECGRVFVQQGALQYLGERDCDPKQLIRYGLAEVADLSGEVRVTVAGATGDRRAPPPAGEAVALRDQGIIAGTDASGVTSLTTRQTEPLLPSAARAPAAPDAPGGPAVAAAPSAPPQAAPSSPTQPIAPGGGGLAAPSSRGVEMQAPAPVASRVPDSPANAARGAPSVAPIDPQAGASMMAEANASTGPAPATGSIDALNVPSLSSDSAVAGIAADSSGVGRTAGGGLPGRSGPGDLGAGVATIALARVEVPTATAAPSSAQSQELRPNTTEADLPVVRSAPAIDASAGERITLLEPSAGLGEILTFGAPLTLVPLDTSQPAPLAAPERDQASANPDVQQAALQPSTDVPPEAAELPQAQPGPTAQPERLAALPRTDLSCAVPPSITLDIRPAGETELVITSPCHADSVALLTYEGIDLGIRIDRSGRGSREVLGFRSSADAILSFADGERLEFSLPFTGTDRVERVALAWNAPVRLELHALEFGAQINGEGHVSPLSPGDFSEVRRRGGGYLKTYDPVEGVGQSVQVYSHWLRRGGETGVVKLYIDFASRHRERLDGTCGSGPLARPAFSVIRSSRGQVESPTVRRLAALDCTAVETVQTHLIEGAVRDIIISQR